LLLDKGHKFIGRVSKSDTFGKHLEVPSSFIKELRVQVAGGHGEDLE
jgi:hypothetical protein